MEGNRDFSIKLLRILEEHNNHCPVMMSSSVQATLQGRFAGSEYGKSKLGGEDAFFQYGERTGAPVYVYRFPNVFGKWSRPDYNSAVATFCYNIARDLPIHVDDRETLLELVYIDDLAEEMLMALQGQAHRRSKAGKALNDIGASREYSTGDAGSADHGMDFCPGRPGCLRQFCYVPVTYRVTLGEIVDLLQAFRRQPETLLVPEIPPHSFAKKLYATYLSYLPQNRVKFALNKREDARGSFTEILRTVSGGQFSVNVSKPGITKGQHWHHSKWELFIVVSGHALIRERNLAGNSGPEKDQDILEYEVWGTRPEAVHMLPGYTHSIVNLSDTEDLITVMWASECFDPDKPDTFHEEV